MALPQRESDKKMVCVYGVCWGAGGTRTRWREISLTCDDSMMKLDGKVRNEEQENVLSRVLFVLNESNTDTPKRGCITKQQ